jgi:hypothetical protein
MGIGLCTILIEIIFFEKGEKEMKNTLFILFFCGSLTAVEKTYIPSYDDWYEDDLKQANANKNYFKEPDDVLNYANYRYIGAHAAEKYPRFFSEYVLQEQPIPGLLATGVRGLMISLYPWAKNWSAIVREGRSILCSRPVLETTTLTKSRKNLYQTLHYEMNRIFNFLKSHPQAVITIIFDDQCDPAQLMKDISSIIAKNNYNPICKPSDWSQAQQKGTWPTLGWMRKNNKRLLLFTQVAKDHTEFTWPLDSYFWENNYGSVDENVVCVEEKASKLAPDKERRSLVNFRCYGSHQAITSARNSRRCFDYEEVKRMTTNCKKRGFARGRLFNGYWVDHVIAAANGLADDKKKSGFDYVNELNVVKGK